MTELSDEQVFGKPVEMSDAQVFGDPMPDALQTTVPEAFLDRVRAGQALTRITMAAGKSAAEGAGSGTPTGFEDETLNHLIDLGVFHDPLKSKPGPLQMANEAVLIPAAKLWEGITRATMGGIHGAGGAMGQIIEEFGGSQGEAQRAKNEVINLGNWAMIEGGMGRFSRPAVEPGGVAHQTVGGLPVAEDFTNAGKVLDSPHAETNLRQMWKEDGIHPAEAVHDAQNDAFLKHDITQGRPEFVPSYTPPDPLDLAMSGSLNVDAAERAAAGVKQYYKDVEKHIFGDRAEEWDKLNRGADRASVNMNDKLSRELREKQAKLEDEVGLSPADEDLLGGAGKPDTYDPDFWKGLKEDLHEIELGRDEALATVAHQVRYLPKSRDWDAMSNSERQSTLVIFSALNAEKAAGRDPMLFLKEAFQQRAARYGGGADAAELVEAQMKELRDLMDGAIERSGVSVPELRALPAPKAMPSAEDIEALTVTGGKPHSLGAAANTMPPMVPLDVQPASPPSSLIARAQQASQKLFDIGHDIQMKLTPMARGTMDSMATIKDYMNNMRRNSWDASRIDTDTVKKFSADDRARMANAMEEESLSLRLGEGVSAREHQGLATLEPEQRAFIVEQDTRQQLAWLRARDLGMVEGEGVPMHFPRMVTGIPKGLDKSGDGMVSLTAIGYDLRSGTPYLKQRKHMELEDTEKAVKEKIGMQLALQGKSVDEINAALEKVKVVRDIRAVNLATKQLEDAVAGRQLVENIKEVGKRTGNEAVAEGFKPDDSWFTVDHPAFKTWRPKFEEVDGKIQTVNGADGKPIFEQVPIYVRGEFEGPLRSAMWGKSGEGYQALMAIKGKTMSYIMNSPMIHNMVEWGRALAAAPFEVGTLRIYFTGNRAKHDVATMHEAIGHGLVPIGKRFFNQDINALMEEPNLTPGRSIEAQAAAMVPGLFDEAAGTAVKQAIDKAGDFWHNTMLWDRIADLQAGLYVHLRDSKISSGMDRDTASYMAARWANQYAGALPKEAMSETATKVSNFMLFSRSFTFGNLSVIKDLFTGMPRDVLAQIERDARFKAGSIEGAEEAGTMAVSDARSMGRRKALMTMSLEMALLYAGNSVLQSAFNVLLGGKALDQEGHDYIRNFRDMLNEKQAHPLSLLQPFHTAESLSSTNANEPNRKDRIYVGHAADGTAIYMRAPWGKIGEEFTNWFSSPIDMAKKKEGTIMRPMMQILSNDAGFKREIYDPRAETWPDYVKSAAAIAKHLVLSQLPVGQFTAGMDLVKGEGDKLVNTLQLAGPFAGFTFSRGAPGGQAVGEMYDAKGRHEFAVNQAMPDIRRQIRRGDTDGAIGRMTELDIPQGLQRWYIKTTLDPALRMSPRAVRDFYLHATPEQRSRFERAQQARPQP